MTPDELMTAWADIIREVIGPKGQWRKEPLTFEEWKQLDNHWLTLKQMYLRQLARKMGKVEDHE